MKGLRKIDMEIRLASEVLSFARRVERGPERVKTDPLGRELCAGEPVLRRRDSPRFIRHPGLAGTAHRSDFRVESLFNECWFNQR
jgi:hypothetical protein